MTIDDADIRQLEDEAALAGDDEMVRHCRCALGGDADSRAAVASIIQAWREERLYNQLRDEGAAHRLAAKVVREVMA